MVDNNWKNKEENRSNAIRHIKEMYDKYNDFIKKSISSTKYYLEDYLFNNVIPFYDYTKIDVVDEDSVSAIYNHYNGKTCVLNFASFKNAGGRYIEGAMAQEEALCSESTLYNVLNAFDTSYYKYNRDNDKNRCMYYNRALYSKDIIFDRNNQPIKCDVITCASPNYKTGARFCNLGFNENIEALTSRVDFVLNIAFENKVETLILGAYGCGVFGQDAKIVSTIFKNLLQTKYKNCFKEVYFAIPKGNNNYERFYNTFLDNY